VAGERVHVGLGRQRVELGGAQRRRRAFGQAARLRDIVLQEERLARAVGVAFLFCFF
jgi:hypothetical protein